MIAYLSGTVAFRESGGVIVLTSGVGYLVHVPMRCLDGVKVGVAIELFIHHYIREDANELFGFTMRDDAAFFKQLIQVSGIGPRLALAALSQYSTTQLQQAIVHGDVAILKSVSGIGKKTAERIVLELKDAVGLLPGVAREQDARLHPSALEALHALGYSSAEAAAALRGVDAVLPLEEQVRRALQQMSGL